MEFLDESETRPRFLFQSRSSAPSLPSLSSSTSPTPSTPSSSGSPSPSSSAPSPLHPSPPATSASAPENSSHPPPLLPPPRISTRKPPTAGPDAANRTNRFGKPSLSKFRKPEGIHEPRRERVGRRAEEERERKWDEGDYELLKKLLAKHPVGKPGRWEAVAEGFDGRHGVESVIRAAKSTGERKINDAYSFARFLKDRKPVDKRIEEKEEESGGDGVVVMRESVGWTGGDDVALLNVLKAFPKDAPMRWEKIAAAVPGKTKGGCVKRVAELKKGVRSSKASSAEA